MNGGPANPVFGEPGFHIFGDPLFWILTVLFFMGLCILTYTAYYFGKGIERAINYGKGNSDHDGREERQDDQQGSSIGYAAQIQSGRRFGDRQNRRNALHSGGKGGSKAQAR